MRFRASIWQLDLTYVIRPTHRRRPSDLIPVLPKVSRFRQPTSRFVKLETPLILRFCETTSSMVRIVKRRNLARLQRAIHHHSFGRRVT